MYIYSTLLHTFITMSDTRQKAKAWIFVHNVRNWDTPPTYDVEKCVWGIWKPEIGDSGNKHWQGAVIFKDRVRIPQIQSILSIPGAHCEVMRGTPQQAREYVLKLRTTAGEPREYGDIPEQRQGRRSDLDTLAEEIKDGATIRDVALRYPATYIRNYRGIATYRSLVLSSNDAFTPRDWQTELHILLGPTGSGKTSYVYSQVELRSDVYGKNPKSKYWNGYRGQPVVLIDDYRGPVGGSNGTGIDYDDLLRLADRYPLSVECKMADDVNFVARKIFITSNTPVETWFPIGTDLRPLQRRITSTRIWSDPDEDVDPDVTVIE